MNVLGCNMTRPNFASGLPTQNVSQKMQFHQPAAPSLDNLISNSPPPNSSRHFQNPNIFNMRILDKNTPSSYKFLNQPESNIDRLNTSSSDSMQVEEVAMEAAWESMSTSSADTSSDDSMEIEFSTKETVESYESDSDDDFIVFEGDDSEGAQDDISADFHDESSSDEEDDDDDDDEDEDDASGNKNEERKERLFFCNFKQTNGTSLTDSEETESCAGVVGEQEENKKSKSTKKVTFAEGPDLAEVHVMIKWSFAYRKARKGIWEQFARDNERFKLRACRFGDTLNKFLLPEHRHKIYEERFKERNE